MIKIKKRYQDWNEMGTECKDPGFEPPHSPIVQRLDINLHLPLFTQAKHFDPYLCAQWHR